MQLSTTNPYVKRTFGCNAAALAPNNVIAFELDAPLTKRIKHISASFSPPLEADHFWKSLVVVFRGKIDEANFPFNISSWVNGKDRNIEYMKWFNSAAGFSAENLSIFAEANETLSIFLFPAFTYTDLVNPATLFGALNVLGNFDESKRLFKAVI